MSEYIVDYELIPLKWRDGYGLSDIDLTEEIVRCRDCVYWSRNAVDGVCNRLNYFTHHMPADGFCSKAERMVD